MIFLIHGFNSHPFLPLGHGSADEFKETRNLITRKNLNTQFYFVEVYWDTLDDADGSKFFITALLNDLKIWPHAQPSATYVGLELRRILTSLQASEIDVITHSHGAGVITTALFNTRKFDKLRSNIESLYKNKDS